MQLLERAIASDGNDAVSSPFPSWLQAKTAEKTGHATRRPSRVEEARARMRVMQAGFLMCCADLYSSACR
jgi:hypothetical protein